MSDFLQSSFCQICSIKHNFLLNYTNHQLTNKIYLKTAEKEKRQNFAGSKINTGHPRHSIMAELKPVGRIPEVSHRCPLLTSVLKWIVLLIARLLLLAERLGSRKRV